MKKISPETTDSFLELMSFEGNSFKNEIKRCIDLLCVREEVPSVDIEQILNFINDNAWDSQLSMNMLVDSLNISERSVRRIMKEKTDKTYKEYVTDIRMKKACELLRDTNLDIQNIVIQVGYYNVPSFNRLFKLKYGVSPGEYRIKESNNSE